MPRLLRGFSGEIWRGWYGQFSVMFSCNFKFIFVFGERVDYEETTNNNDRDKIIATIFYITQMFTAAYPYQKIFIRGRNAATTRLYRGAINHGYDGIVREYFIYGGTYMAMMDKYNFEPFIPNKQYDAFLFERR